MKLSTIGGILVALSIGPLVNNWGLVWKAETYVAFWGALSLGLFLICLGFFRKKKN